MICPCSTPISYSTPHWGHRLYSILELGGLLCLWSLTQLVFDSRVGVSTINAFPFLLPFQSPALVRDLGVSMLNLLKLSWFRSATGQASQKGQKDTAGAGKWWRTKKKRSELKFTHYTDQETEARQEEGTDEDWDSIQAPESQSNVTFPLYSTVRLLKPGEVCRLWNLFLAAGSETNKGEKRSSCKCFSSGP